MNRVIIDGTLTRAAEIAHTAQNGSILVKMSVANNDRRVKGQDENGNEAWNSVAQFFNVETWMKSGSKMFNHLWSGNTVTIDGELRFEKWEDKNTGEKRSKVFIVIDGFNGGSIKPHHWKGDKNGQFNSQQPAQSQQMNGTGPYGTNPQGSNANQQQGNQQQGFHNAGFSPQQTPQSQGGFAIPDDFDDDIPF